MSERRTFLKNALVPLALSMPLQALQERANESQQTENTVTPSNQESTHTPQLPKLSSSPQQPKEQSFTEFHLLGTPDKRANLLGEDNRPTNWKNTKMLVGAGLKSSCQPHDPIHDWLDTFMQSFDERATRMVLNTVSSLSRSGRTNELYYEPQLYDASLRSAAVQLDRCLRYRNELGGYEISGVSAAIAYLTFLKMRPIQRNLITQSSLADLEELQRSVAARTADIYAHAHGISKLFEKYQLLGLRSDAEGNVTESELAEQKDKLRTELLERQFNIHVDAQLAEFTRLLSPGSASNFAERYLRLLTYLGEDLADVYRKLYSASVGISQVLHFSSMPAGGGTIPVAIPQFTDSASVLSWVHQLIPTNAGDQRQPDVLDAFVLWSRAAMRELDRRGQYETEFTVAIPLNQPAGKRNSPVLSKADMNVAFAQAKPTGLVRFVVDNSVLPFPISLTDLRVVAVGLSVERSQDDASPVQYATTFQNAPPKPIVQVGQTPSYDPNPPSTQVDSVRSFEGPKFGRLNATLTSPPQTLPGSGTYQRSPIILANVRMQGGASGDMEPVLSNDPACRNLAPFGKWSIQFDPNVIEYYQSDTAIPDSWITGLILHLRLRVTAA
jgi:hypothetical protein